MYNNITNQRPNSFPQICDRIKNHGWTVVKDPEGRMGPYAYKGNQWVGYDDIDMIRYKVGSVVN